MNHQSQYPENFKHLVEEQMQRGKASRRARDVARILLERGSCSTTDLEELGYKHSPRAVRDLKEAGIDLITTRETYIDPVTNTKKRRARYEIVGIDPDRVSRRPFSKAISEAVKSTGKCESCGASGQLQIDHRVPFEIGGESYPHLISELMPLCPSCNRAKSWSCENCPNWAIKDIATCQTCRWASPIEYNHVATEPVREFRGVLTDPETIDLFDKVKPDTTSIVEQWLKNQLENRSRHPE